MAVRVISELEEAQLAELSRDFGHQLHHRLHLRAQRGVNKNNAVTLGIYHFLLEDLPAHWRQVLEFFLLRLDYFGTMITLNLPTLIVRYELLQSLLGLGLVLVVFLASLVQNYELTRFEIQRRSEFPRKSFE